MKNKTGLGFRGDTPTREWSLAIGTSVLIHVILLVIVVVFSGNSQHQARMPKSIDVDLAYIPAPKTTPSAPKKTTKTKAKKKVRKKTVKKKAVSKKTVIPSKNNKKQKKQKKKVVKPRDIINNAIKDLEKDLDKTRPDPIAERMRQLEEETETVQTLKGETTETPSKSSSGSGKGEATLLDRYKHNISMVVWENWAFSENLAGGKKNLETRISFQVMPDGEIRDIRFKRKSGSSYMDSAASMAVVKSSPVMPHPKGITKPYVEVKLSFTPDGLHND